jgi:hypothetical protein
MTTVALLAWMVVMPATTTIPEVSSSSPRSVSWSRELAPAGGDGAAKALGAPLAETWDARNPRTGEERHVTTCREVLALPDTFVPVGPESDYQAFEGMYVRCRVIAELPALKPALVSHLGEFALDDARLRELPAVLIPAASRGERRALEVATAKGTTWPKRERGVRVTNHRDGRVLVESKRSRCFLQVFARGDSNGDGVEDLYLWRAGGGQRGTWASTEVFVLTRRTEAGRLEILRRIEYRGE